jgi:hypothetical protein
MLVCCSYSCHTPWCNPPSLQPYQFQLLTYSITPICVSLHTNTLSCSYCFFVLLTAPSYGANNLTTQHYTDRQQSDQASASAAAAAPSAADRAWQSITVPNSLGLAAVRHKWRQNLSHVEVFVQLPQTISPKQVGCGARWIDDCFWREWGGRGGRGVRHKWRQNVLHVEVFVRFHRL